MPLKPARKDKDTFSWRYLSFIYLSDNNHWDIKKSISAIVVAEIAGEWFPYDRWIFFFSAIAAITAIVALIWKPGLIYCNNHPPFLLNCYLYFLQTYRTHSSKLWLLLVLKGTMAFFLELHKGAQHCLNTAYSKFLTSHYCLELILSHESWSYWCSTAWWRFGQFNTHFLANSSNAVFLHLGGF